jgi:putative transposase
MSLAFDKIAVVKEYKEELEELKKDNDTLAKKVGNLTIEKDFLEGKFVSLVSSNKRKKLIDTKLKISLNKQCELLKVNKSSLYPQGAAPIISQ